MYFLNPLYQVRFLSENQLALFSEDDNYFIQDASILKIVKYLFEDRPTADLSYKKLHAPHMESNAFERALADLLDKGIIIKADEHKKGLHSLNSIYWHLLNRPLKHAQTKISSQTVSVISLTECSIAEMIEPLKKLGIQTGEDGDIYVVIVNDYLDKKLKVLSDQMLKLGRTWILIKPTGRRIWVGPIFNSFPELSYVNWDILSTRIKENIHSKADILGFDSEAFSSPHSVEIPTNTPIAFNMAANEILKWIVNKGSGLIDSVLTYNSLTMETTLHRLSRYLQQLQNPQKPPKTIELQEARKEFINEMGERSCSPEITYEKVKDFISPITGFVSKCYYKKVNDLHVYFGPRSLTFPDKEAIFIPPRAPEIVVGKSKSNIEAQVAFIAEALERYFSGDIGLHSKIDCCYREIIEQAIHPNILMNYSVRQFSQRVELNQSSGPFHWIPLPFDECTEISWIKLASLRSSTPKFFPASYCYMNSPHSKAYLMCPGDSNGCASGNTFEEALYYALLEVIERDAMAIWWYNCLNRPSVDLSSFYSSYIEKTVRDLKQNQRVLRIIDISTELEIPVFVAVSWKEDGSRIILGSGAHLDPQIAIHRAIAEHNQILTRADVSETIDLRKVLPAERGLVRWIIKEKITSHPFLITENKRSGIKEGYAKKHSNDFHTDIQTCLQALERSRLDAYWLTLTPSEFPLKVVKVIVPGMRHFWKRMGEGRLYDVPVLMGDLETARLEENMNPISYFV